MTNQILSEREKKSVKWLTFIMFLIFAMTTDAVGVIIPEVIKTFGLTLTQAATFHYATMIAIAVSGICLGYLGDRFGRKLTIVGGLALFALASFLFAVGSSFGFFLLLLVAIGTAVGIFKTAALALIGDISSTPAEHTKTMNLVEGFFGIGAIIGPALVVYLLAQGISWTYLYVVAGGLAVLLIVLASVSRYPEQAKEVDLSVNWKAAFSLAKDWYALFFSSGIALYVIVECAIYVWMPTWFLEYDGNYPLLATYALSVFFTLRAAGRFLAVLVLNLMSWQMAMVVCTGAIFVCYLGSIVLGVNYAVWLLPASGLFMSLIYPTLNSKGISGFEPHKHSSAAGLILFFTAVAAAVGPLLMGVIGDFFGHLIFGFVFCAACAGVLFLGCIFNFIKDPSSQRLSAISLKHS